MRAFCVFLLNNAEELVAECMKYQPLTRNHEFVRAYTKGKAYVHAFLVVYVNRNRFHTLRIGTTASKKVGNAVKRNRARRIMKEALYQMPLCADGYDIVLVARAATPGLKTTQLVPVLEKLLKKAQVLSDDIQ